MNLASEIFVITEDNRNYVYAPLSKTFMEVTGGVINLLKSIQSGKYQFMENHTKVISGLKDGRIVVENEETIQDIFSQDKNETTNFSPKKVTLFPTTRCNLRCTYCYANGGESDDKDMPLSTAKSAIDFVIENCIGDNEEKAEVTFHGGGEPFMNWSLMIQALDYAQLKAKQLGISIYSASGTNGVLNRKQLEWVVKNKMGLTISIDGTREVHDLQRPLKNGAGTFNKIINSIKFLEDNEYRHYDLRTTVTKHNLHKLSEIVDFLCEFSSTQEYHFEPVHECGRCFKTGIGSINMQEFAEELIKVSEYAEKKSKTINYSGVRHNSVLTRFCGASGDNFFVTPHGDITSCLEVSQATDPKSEIFMYGKIERGKIKIDWGKLNYLSSRTIENIPHCADCYAKFSCAGDCPANISDKGDIFDVEKNPRCETNRRLLLQKLKGGLNNGQTKI